MIRVIDLISQLGSIENIIVLIFEKKIILYIKFWVHNKDFTCNATHFSYVLDFVFCPTHNEAWTNYIVNLLH
jgi:hypothetical protein